MPSGFLEKRVAASQKGGGYAVGWMITIEGADEFGSAHLFEIAIEKVAAWPGAIGLSIEDGKAIMAHLQKNNCEAAMRDLRLGASFLRGL